MSVIPKDFGKAARWTTPGLSAELQEQVAERMEKHVAKLEEKGVINQDNITRVVVCKQVARLLHNTGISPTEAAWAWVAEQKTLGRFENRPIYRRVQGPVEIEEPGWENAAQLRVDWNGSRESGCTQAQLNQLQKTVRVERALRQHTGMVGRSWGNAESSSESEEEDEPTGIGRTETEVEVDPESVEMAWQTTKGHFKGEGGKAQFWICMGVLLLEGRVHGGVGIGPRVGTWWAEARKLAMTMGQCRGPLCDAHWEWPTVIRGQKKTAKGVVRVAIDLMAYTQSARLQLERKKGVLYLPMDKLEWVYSAIERQWVQNIVCDVLTDSPEELLEKARQGAQTLLGEEGYTVIEVVALWTSPECRTFSKADSTNRSRGWSFRDHTLPHRPPLQGPDTKWGMMARRADRLVQRTQEVIRVWSMKFPGMVWVMENPVGSLAKQVYMGKRWKQPRKLEEVHYCAYGHVYNKPTHIWTNLYEWKPQGQTGTGKCECRCNAGRVGPKGKWRHRYTIAGDSAMEVQGRGKAAIKNMVPQLLQQEIWESWME